MLASPALPFRSCSRQTQNFALNNNSEASQYSYLNTHISILMSTPVCRTHLSSGTMYALIFLILSLRFCACLYISSALFVSFLFPRPSAKGVFLPPLHGPALPLRQVYRSLILWWFRARLSRGKDF